MGHRKITLILLLLLPVVASAQSYNTDLVELTNYVKRMYKSEPFTGVRVIEDYDNCYMLSVISLETSKYKDENAMNRVASVKAMSEASRFFNGSNITSECIIRTTKKEDSYSDTEIIENINEHSIGYVKALQILATFKDEKSPNQIFIFLKKMDMPEKGE